MSKYRKNRELRVAYGFSGRIQDEMEAYLGFREIADALGWQVWVLHEQFETQLRGLLERGVVDAVIGNFISLRWLQSLPGSLAAVHRGAYPLDAGVFSVSLDLAEGMERVRAHFEEMGYPRSFYYALHRAGGMPWIRSENALRDLLQGQEAAGIFCGSDYLARQGIQLARRLGKSVPAQFGFVGLGNRRLDRLLADMEITSLPEPHREMGRQSAKLLQEQVAGAAPCQVRLSAGQLIPRQSSRRQRQGLRLRERLDELLLPRLSDPPPVEAWARRMGMSRRSFENAFSQENGCTPYVYFMHLRCLEAQRLLSQTDWTIARIGQTVGIPDPPRFSAFFRKLTGQTPSRWRQQN